MRLSNGVFNTLRTFLSFRDTMTAMRALLAFSLVLLFAVPLFVSAVELPVDKDVCRSNRLSIEKGEVRLANTEPATYKKCTELKGKNATNAQLEGRNCAAL